ncbi:substrate-binding periplasmic protein [Shewanella sediminis]|nr:transporter substrate-binding domain-containing protein [Shewanella sediminis]
MIFKSHMDTHGLKDFMPNLNLLPRALSLLLCLISYNLAADDMAKTIKLAAEDNWAPYAESSGSGLSHSLINSAFSRVGIEVDSIVVPYARAVVMAKKGIVDGVFNLIKEKSTQDQFIFGKQALFSATASFYQNKQSPLNVESKWLLPKNTRVGVIDGYEYGDELSELPNIQVIKLSNHNQLINLLLLNRIDTAIMYDLVAEQYIARMRVSSEIGSTFINHTGQVYLAFSKKNPEAEHLAEMLDTGLTALKHDGSYQQIMTSSLETAHHSNGKLKP